MLKQGKRRGDSLPSPGLASRGHTWNGLPIEKRNGASVWVPASYDRALNLAFFGPAQTYDTGPLRNPADEGDVTNDGLYTDSTLAINVDPGKLVWFFQHQPNDQWDLDWAFERHVISLRVNGVEKTLVVTGGKQAIFDAMEAATGAYAFSMELGVQNVVTAIDPKTGAKTIDPKLVPGDGETKFVCPHAGGAKSWLPSLYNPLTKMLYVPLVESCMDLTPVEKGGRGSLSTGVRWSLRPRPNSDGNGRLQAINLETHQSVWIERQRAPQTTGALATAGGVVFAGALDRVFAAYDDSTGKEFWRARLGYVPSNAPISYLPTGNSSRRCRWQRRCAGDHLPALVPEIGIRRIVVPGVGVRTAKPVISGLSALGSRLELKDPSDPGSRIPDPGYRVAHGAGFHFEPSGSFLKWLVVTHGSPRYRGSLTWS